jgi:hypothetical protein
MDLASADMLALIVVAQANCLLINKTAAESPSYVIVLAPQLNC